MPVDYSNTASSIKKWVDNIAFRIKRQLVVDRTHASRRTYDSIETRMEGQLRAELLSRQAKGSNLPVLDFVDQGRRRGKMPPVEEIMEWMDDKRVRPRKKGKFIRSTPSEKRRAAFAIAKAIGEKGAIKRFGNRGSDIYTFVTQPVMEEMTNEILSSYVADVERHIANR